MAYTNGRAANVMIDGYTKKEADQVTDQKIEQQLPNPNLLINGFLDINQRNTMDKPIMTSGIRADRWRYVYGSNKQSPTTGYFNHSKLNAEELKYLPFENYLSVALNDVSELDWGMQVTQSIDMDYSSHLGEDFTFQFFSRFNPNVSSYNKIAVELGAYTGTEFLSFDTKYVDLKPEWDDYAVHLKIPKIKENFQAVYPSQGNPRLYLMIWIVVGENGTNQERTSRVAELTPKMPIGVFLANMKLEMGINATRRIRNDVAAELLKCQRYYYEHILTLEGYSQAAGQKLQYTFPLPTKMRTTPSVSYDSSEAELERVTLSSNGFSIFARGDNCVSYRLTSNAVGNTRVDRMKVFIDAEL